MGHVGLGQIAIGVGVQALPGGAEDILGSAAKISLHLGVGFEVKAVDGAFRKIAEQPVPTESSLRHILEGLTDIPIAGPRS